MVKRKQDEKKNEIAMNNVDDDETYLLFWEMQKPIKRMQ